MQIYLKERIGKPELFTGRKRELASFLKWIDGVKEEISKSTAILSRRKTGKTALLERLYNLTFEQHDKVVPFYFEIREADQWLGNFAKEFFFGFLYQYLAFQTRNRDYLSGKTVKTFETALQACQQAGLESLYELTRAVQAAYQTEDIDGLWNFAREAPAQVAAYTGDRIVQMIDEFQFLNRHIFRDRGCTNCIDNLAGS